MAGKKIRATDKHKPCVVNAGCDGYSLMGRIWVEGRAETFLGHGRVVLLERIKQYGSIAGAAKSLNMSYRHAWDLIASMNRQSKTPLVETAIGGRDGGGTKLTKKGERVFQSFKEFHRNFQLFLEGQSKILRFD